MVGGARGMGFFATWLATTHVCGAATTAATADTGDAHVSPQIGRGFRHTGLETGKATFRVRFLRPTEPQQ